MNFWNGIKVKFVFQNFMDISIDIVISLGEELNCDSQVLSTFTLLRTLLEFFDYYHEKKYQLALDALEKTKLVPLNMYDLETCINNFKRYLQ